MSADRGEPAIAVAVRQCVLLTHQRMAVHCGNGFDAGQPPIKVLV